MAERLSLIVDLPHNGSVQSAVQADAVNCRGTFLYFDELLYVDELLDYDLGAKEGENVWHNHTRLVHDPQQGLLDVRHSNPVLCQLRDVGHIHRVVCYEVGAGACETGQDHTSCGDAVVHGGDHLANAPWPREYLIAAEHNEDVCLGSGVVEELRQVLEIVGVKPHALLHELVLLQHALQQACQASRTRLVVAQEELERLA
mmetsp:Transcript_31855/g.82423  ORF Transcript_31855/g.82423 Transcript_31855/m.82423 type:complete len:201 (+) Transcript_31855:622-1224(+)